MKNYTIAIAKVNIYDILPNINHDYKKYDFDISAFNWTAIQNSNIFRPMLLEQVEDNNQGFAAIFPSKRKYAINNYITRDLSTWTAPSEIGSLPYIVWKPLRDTEISGAFKDKLPSAPSSTAPSSSASTSTTTTTTTSSYDYYDSSIKYVGNDSVPREWKGPVWMNTQVSKLAYPDDVKVIKEFLTTYNFPENSDPPNIITDERYDATCMDSMLYPSSSTTTPSTTPSPSPSPSPSPYSTTTTTTTATSTSYLGIPNIQNIWQQNVREGLWWGIRSHPFLKTNMPFWISVSRNQISPSSDKAPTYLVIRLGRETTDQRYDIWIGSNIKPFIIDYMLAPPPDPDTTAAAVVADATAADEATAAAAAASAAAGVPPSSAAPAIGSSSSSGAPTTPPATPPATPLAGGIYMEFEDDLSRILDTTSEIEIGVMTIAGRLIVFVNNNSFVYTRVEKSTTTDGGTLKECIITAGDIDIYGTNMQLSINASPMTFAPMGIMNVPMPAEVASTDPEETRTAISPESPPGLPPSTLSTPSIPSTTPPSFVWNWHGINYKGVPDITKSVCELPKPPSIAYDIFGTDCEHYIDGGIAATAPASAAITPSGSTSTDFHLQGKVRFKRAGPTTFPSMLGTDIYYVSMFPLASKMDLPVIGTVTPGTAAPTADICYGGCPYFFRLKGGYVPWIPNTFPVAVDISDNVLSISESASAGDYFHVKKTATVIVYNPNGIISGLGDSNSSSEITSTTTTSTATATISTSMLKYQKGIDISWSWGDDTPVKTFTGIITNVNSTEVAGKEVLTLTCADYMYILNAIPIINSPFYDGMVAKYAIKELAMRSGLLDASFSVDWTSADDYFLPSGFAYSQPAMRFQTSQKLLECMIDIVKRFEAFIYFDGAGVLHINKLPGGLFSVPVATTAVEFHMDMTTDIDGTILNERNVDFNFDSTVNCISLFTLDRNSRNAIIYGKTATGAEDRLPFRKPMLLDQPALGELPAAKAWVADLALRVFKPILKTRFSCVFSTDKATILPLSFITLDGQNFRVTSVKRDFSAENNDFKASFECEWLGG